MRRDKTVARILLIFSVVNVALAAPAVTRQGHLAKDVTAASEKRDEKDDAQNNQLDQPGPSESDSDPPRYSTPPPPPSKTKHVTWYDGYVRPPDDPPDQPGPSGPSVPPSSPEKDADGRVPPSESVHSATLPEPVFDSSPHDSASESESESEPTDTPDHSHHSTTPSPGSTSSHDSAPDKQLEPLAPPKDISPSGSGILQPHNDPPKTGPEIPEHYNNMPEIGAAQSHDHSVPDPWWHSSWQPVTEIEEVASSHSESVATGAPGVSTATAAVHEPPSAPPEPDSKVEKFFSEEMKQKVKDYAVLGTIAGISTGIINGVQKEIMGTLSPGAQTIGRDLASSDFIRRGAGTPLHITDHFQPRNGPVSRGLANMKDEDLRLLSVLTRRALENLD